MSSLESARTALQREIEDLRGFEHERRTSAGQSRGMAAHELDGRSSVVDQVCVALLAGAVCAAEELAVRLETVPQDPALTVFADRSDPLGRAFEAVEDVKRSRRTYLERHLVVIAAYFAYRHRRLTPRAVHGCPGTLRG
jgi:hypothetical protein